MSRPVHIAFAAAATAALLCGQALAAPSTWAVFDEQILAAKTAMNTSPKIAETRTLQALKIAEANTGDPRREIAIATAHWLQGEALIRLNHADLAEPILSDAIAV